MADGITAEKELEDKFAQLDWYRKQIRGAHGAVGGAVAPAIDIRREMHQVNKDFGKGGLSSRRIYSVSCVNYPAG